MSEKAWIYVTMAGDKPISAAGVYATEVEAQAAADKDKAGGSVAVPLFLFETDLVPTIRIKIADTDARIAREVRDACEDRVLELLEALRAISELDAPRGVEDVKDFQAHLFHRAQAIARSAVAGVEPDDVTPKSEFGI